MTAIPQIELRPRRQKDLVGGRASYSIFAGEMQVGSIYEAIHAGNTTAWVWNIAGVVTDNRDGITKGGAAPELEEARRRFRVAFDLWLAWALSQPADHLSFDTIDKHLRRMGAR